MESAPAERRDDGALAIGTLDGASQRSVALRLPPHSDYSAPVVGVDYPKTSLIH
jgi:hypothetical protein